MDGGSDERSRGPRITWSQVALAATLVAIAAVTALVIVAAERRVEALASIALSIAILTFVVQILVFVSQSWTTSRLNAESRSALTEISAAAEETRRLLEGTNRNVERTNERVIDYMTRSKRAGDAAAAPTTGAIGSELGPIAGEGSIATIGAEHWPRSVPRDPSRLRVLRSRVSPDQYQELLPLVESLSGLAIANLIRLFEDERRSLEVGLEPGLRLDAAAKHNQELVKEGLIAVHDIEELGSVVTLTEQGRLVARLLTLGPPTPIS